MYIWQGDSLQYKEVLRSNPGWPQPTKVNCKVVSSPTLDVLESGYCSLKLNNSSDIQMF